MSEGTFGSGLTLKVLMAVATYFLNDNNILYDGTVPYTHYIRESNA
jgi:hypothetical protein